MEIDPSRFVLVLGPSFTAALLHQMLDGEGDTPLGSAATPSSAAKLPAFDVKGLVKEGVDILLESRPFQTDAERREYEQLYSQALEVDPLPQLSTSLQQCGRYVEWLERCFRLDGNLLAKCSDKHPHPPLLSHLVDLVERGALLLYTGCDEVLSKLTNLQVLLAQNQETVGQWGRGELRGILQPHGIYHKPDTLQLGCEVYQVPQHPCRAAMEQIGAIVRGRCVMTLGMYERAQRDNPMVAKFAATFLEVGNGHRFNLTLELDCKEESALNIYCDAAMAQSQVRPLSEASQVLCKQAIYPLPCVSVCACAQHTKKVFLVHRV